MALPHVHRLGTDDFLAIDGLPQRVELIDGVVCAMSPEGATHAEAQALVLRRLMAALDEWSVVAGGSVRVTEHFCPIPDAAVYPRGADGDAWYAGADARLIVEVGVATAAADRSVKLAGYAGGSVAEVWLIAPAEGTLTCHRDPVDGRYRDVWALAWPDGLPAAVDRLVARLG